MEWSYGKNLYYTYQYISSREHHTPDILLILFITFDCVWEFPLVAPRQSGHLMDPSSSMRSAAE